jgi:hypothetical protein
MKDTKFVVFIDALSPNDLSRTDFMPSTQAGQVDIPAPRVTPRVVSSVYTGMNPAETGMIRKHAHGGADPDRPEQTTVMEKAQHADLDVLNLYMPYCIPQRYQNGSAGIGTSAGEVSATPQEMTGTISVPGPSGDLVGEQRHDIAFDFMVDYTNALFSTARTLSVDFDVVFIGFRAIDSYCHFQYDTGVDGRHADVGDRYRDRLAEVVDIQLRQLEPRGDVLWFSDHGATNRTETFRVNKWLAEKGYLDYTVDEEFREQAREYGMMRGEQHPIESRVENQFIPGAPGVAFSDDSQAICSDPYDSCITLLDESVQEDIVADLESLDQYRAVHTRDKLYDEDDHYFENAPHIIPDRDEGVFVSNNVHPDPIGMGWYRTGVHDKWGCYGSTTGVGGGTVTPAGLNAVLEQFLGIDETFNPVSGRVETLTQGERQALKQEL